MSQLSAQSTINDGTRRLPYVHIKGARSNNLKNIELKIPKNKLIVVTGLSGSGKSSLIMDTLYAEGQRRYVESLSSYARQFLMRMKKPEVDFIKGISPAIAIEQKVGTRNARSTVGSLTEIIDFLRVLYARIGKTISPISGEQVRKHSVSDVIDYMHSWKDGQKIILQSPFSQKILNRTAHKHLDILLQKGFTRLYQKGEILRIEDILGERTKLKKQYVKDLKAQEYTVLIDRLVVNHKDEENRKRIADSILSAFDESEGECLVEVVGQETKEFNNRFELDGISFLEPSPQLFNSNNPYGACKKCEGYGKILGIDEKKVIPNTDKSIFEGAVLCWTGEKSKVCLENFMRYAGEIHFPIHRAYKDLTKEEKSQLWNGSQYAPGIHAFFQELESKSYKIQNRVLLARYRGRTTCTACEGSRLRPESGYVKIQGTAIHELLDLPIDEFYEFINQLNLEKVDAQIANRLLVEIRSRLQIMMDIGLSYLTLNRVSSSLSGGETQRINLTRTLGSNLTSSLYILDEPSIGLHPKDSNMLVDVLKSLRDYGNTVIVVEHEEEIIRNADYIIEIGPKAGIFGGEVVFEGPFDQLLKTKESSITGKYLRGEMFIPNPLQRRKVINKILIKGARQHNLQNIDVTIPLNSFVVISGVSGSGKSTLVNHILYPGIKKHLGEAYNLTPGLYAEIAGDLNQISQIEYIGQQPIGKSSRSNPITYVKAFDPIRKLYANTQLSRIRGYAPKHFSFNVDGGRCDNCKGEGEIIVEMQFLADVRLECEDCKGKRFNKEVLDVQFNGKNIYDVLDTSIEEAMEFFKSQKEILKKIKPLYDVGLGYLKLGQSSSTLSGGEAQRVKLASYLNKESNYERILFIFDEPTTGLHFDDINKLLYALNALIEKGHSVIVVEHNMDVIKAADWVIDLGPGGGKHGGELLFEGTPEDLVHEDKSYTGMFLKGKLRNID